MPHAFRFIHAADLHLDTPFQGVARPAPGVARALREASLEAWERLVDLALERRVLFVLLAGDIHDGAERGLRAQIRFLAGVRRLDEAGIRTFVVHGNHDPLDGWSAVTGWPAGVTVFGAQRVESVPVELHGAQVAVVHGISYARREVRENLALRFSRAGGPGLHIGLLHANVGSSAEHAAYAPCTLGDLAASGMDYWALGHIHRRQVLRDGAPWVVYPGDTQGRSPKPSETGAKGCYLVSVAGGVVEGLEFCPLDAVRFVEHRCDVAGAADVGALHARLAEALDMLRGEHQGLALLVRLVLEGRGPVAADLARDGVGDDLRATLRETFGVLEPFLWVESIVNATRSALDRVAIRARGADDFAAGLLAYADTLSADPEAAQRFVADSGRLLSVGQVERAVRDLQDDDPGEVLAAATDLALDAVERGAS
ncbi:MAG: DNA repair exonuclease [Acidobacteriota bacterium]|nr:DNA repair exonuclease [Acidobacteriota bacterium]